MRAVVQLVSRAAVRLSSGEERSLGSGMVVFLAVTHGDDREDVAYLVRKLVQLRIFPDQRGMMNLNLSQAGGGVLVVSQFTLYADVRRGNRPSFTRSAPPETAVPLYEQFIRELRAGGIPVVTGEFGDHMEVELVNAGPVTILLDSAYSSRSGPPF